MFWESSVGQLPGVMTVLIWEATGLKKLGRGHQTLKPLTWGFRASFLKSERQNKKWLDMAEGTGSIQNPPRSRVGRATREPSNPSQVTVDLKYLGQCLAQSSYIIDKIMVIVVGGGLYALAFTVCQRVGS